MKEEKKYICVLRTLCGCEKIFDTNSEPRGFLDVPIVEEMKDILRGQKHMRTFELVHTEDDIFFYRECILPKGAR